MIIEERLMPGGAPSIFCPLGELWDSLDMNPTTKDNPVLPADLLPTVTSALPLTVGELCAVNDGMECLINARTRVMDAIDNMEVMS